MGVRGDRKALHLKLSQIGRGGLAGRQGALWDLRQGQAAHQPLPTETTLQEFGATGNWGYRNFSVGDDGAWGMMALPSPPMMMGADGRALAVALREPQGLSRRGTEQGSKAGGGVLWGRGPS